MVDLENKIAAINEAIAVLNVQYTMVINELHGLNDGTNKPTEKVAALAHEFNEAITALEDFNIKLNAFNNGEGF